jgi:hypothetical protein
MRELRKDRTARERTLSIIIAVVVIVVVTLLYLMMK